MKRCPMCAEAIQDDATKCRHCGSMLDGGVDSQFNHGSGDGIASRAVLQHEVIEEPVITGASGMPTVPQLPTARDDEQRVSALVSEMLRSSTSAASAMAARYQADIAALITYCEEKLAAVQRELSYMAKQHQLAMGSEQQKFLEKTLAAERRWDNRLKEAEATIREQAEQLNILRAQLDPGASAPRLSAGGAGSNRREIEVARMREQELVGEVKILTERSRSLARRLAELESSERPQGVVLDGGSLEVMDSDVVEVPSTMKSNPRIQLPPPSVRGVPGKRK